MLRLTVITMQTIQKKNWISIEFSKKIAKFNENCLFVPIFCITMKVRFQSVRQGTTNIEKKHMQHMTISPCCCSKEVFLISSS
jgi:hypothetical protein